MKRFIMILSFVFAVVLTACICGTASVEKYEVNEIAKADYGTCEEHVYPNDGEYITIEPGPSCSRKGAKYRICAVCGYYDIVELPKDPDKHSLVSKDLTYESKPTCAEGGVGYYVCLGCNKAAERVELPPDPEAHVKDGDFVVLKKETCTNNGTMAHKCKYCSAYFNHQSIPSDPMMHVLTDSSKWVVTKLPTCAEAGSVDGYCDECYKVCVTRTVPATGNHTPEEEWLVVTEPTCSSDGVKAHKCSVCNQPVDETPIPSEPEKHTFADKYTIDVPATCTTEGSESRHCLYCDAKVDERVVSVDASAHSYGDEWIVTQEPSCSQSGYKHRVCKLCNEDSIATLIPRTEHTYPDEYEIIKESADGTSVQVKYICEVCSYKYITIITIGNNPGEGNIGDTVDPITKKYYIRPVEKTVIRVDYDKMIISNVVKEMTVEDFLDKFLNGNVFVIYNPKDRFISEEDNIGTGCRLNYETPDGNVTNYYVSVTGDLDSNGEITAADARKILRISAKIDNVSEPYLTAADVNYDGKITASDARKTLLVAANLEFFDETYEY